MFVPSVPSVLSKSKVIGKKFETYPMLYMYAIWVVYGYYMDDMCNTHMLKNKKKFRSFDFS